jgi:hypothetical protein
MCLSTLGFWFFKSVMHLSEKWNIICGIGLIIVTIASTYFSIKANRKDKQNEEIKKRQDSLEEELKAKVDYERQFAPQMIIIQKRLDSKADDAELKGLKDKLNAMDKIIDRHFHDIDKNLDGRFKVMDKNLGDRFDDMKTFIRNGK